MRDPLAIMDCQKISYYGKCKIRDKISIRTNKVSWRENSFELGKYLWSQNVSLRFFNVYGPRSRTTGAYGAVFGVFLAQKISNKPLTIVGNGKQTRDFVRLRLGKWTNSCCKKRKTR